MRQAGYDMLYLCRCAVNNEVPGKERVEKINFENLYVMCKCHSLAAMACMALDVCGISQSNFVEAKEKSVRKNILLRVEQKRICEYMEKNGIKNMPLKGAFLNDLYPKLGMRQMSDIDLLYDKDFQKQMTEFMKQSGYTVENVGIDHHDEYTKLPVYNFELHRDLLSGASKKEFLDYYENIWDKLILDDGKKYSYHFSDEEFYIFMLLHEYKHYIGAGTGLRSLIDTAVFLSKKPELDMEYIHKATEKLGVAEFEESTRNLALKVFFGNEELSDEETKMLETFLFSGTYGNENKLYESNIDKYFEKTGSKSKFRYVLNRFFPSMEFYKLYYPFFYKYKFMLPFAVFYRIFRLIFFKRKRVARELGSLKKYDK